jgi:hypothetical protein
MTVAVRTVAVALLALALAAAPALADTFYRGRTSQHFRASMRVKDDGQIARVKLRHRARCRGRRYWAGPRREGFTSVPDDPITRRGNRFFDGPTRVSGREGRLRHRLVGSLRGRFRSNGRVTAVFRFRARTYRRGRLIGDCRAKVRLRLHRVSG